MLVCDGTYYECRKSGTDNYFQRLSYSGQKKKHLLKPFVICASNGRILGIYGLYQATMNDANILLHILKSDSDLRNLLKQDDILLLDRGFRDCVDELRDNYKLNPKMPYCKFYFY